MPHTKSAKKRLRQSEERRIRNRSVLRDLRTHIKKLLLAVKEQDQAQADAMLRLVYRKLDKAATRRYLHPNTAHRTKSRLTKRVQAMGTADATAS